jgi:hypothetical protein
MNEKKNPPLVTLKNVKIKNVGRHGINTNSGVDATDTEISDCGGDAIHTRSDESKSEDDPDRPWYERPLGIVLLLVTAGLIVAFLAFRFGWAPA